MKKMFMVLMVLVLCFMVIGCNNSGNDQFKFNTPTWIRGTWQGTVNDQPYQIIFTSNDIQINGYSLLIERWSETVTANTYQINNYNKYSPMVYKFSLINTNTLKVEKNNLLIANLTKVLP